MGAVAGLELTHLQSRFPFCSKSKLTHHAVRCSAIRSVVQGKLCRRIERHIKELLVFVAEPDVPADNNAAERSQRHLVISRKISGGTRSEQGTQSKMTLASLFGTWRAQGLNPLAACRQLLVSPKL